MTGQKNSSGIRFGIAFKLGVILATFGVLASGLTGYYSYTAGRDLLVKTAERDLLTSTHVVGRRLSIALGAVAKDALLLAAIPVTARIAVAPDDPSAAPRKTTLADDFSALLSVHPEYFQVRLISAGNNGMELVRVERDQSKLKRIVGADLQEKGHFPYVFQALRLASGHTYLSKITINHEWGAHSGLDKPTLQVATPVQTAVGRMRGLVVINIDLNGLFELLKADVPGDFRVFLTNEWGDFLVHPDASQTFGFDSGRRILVQDTFASVSEIIEGKTDSVVINAGASDRQPGESVTAFVKLAFGDANARRFVILGLSQPLQSVLHETRNLGINTLQMVLGFSILAILLSAIVSRAMTGPLNMMVQAANRFSDDHVTIALPLERKDELGQLARSLNDMQAQIKTHLSELYESKRDVDHLARHDALTGLANRLMFHDRLEHAIANSQRSGKKVALIYIDLDGFKEINDSGGHALGDKVLTAVSAQLKKSVREIDTVARLGGDEFIILIGAIDNPDQVGLIAQKLLEGFRVPMNIDGRSLPVGISIGISVFPRDGANATELLDKADLAMYRSKKQGGNTYHFYSADMTADASVR
ncbi:MAG: diguanylate cyclase [Betaproteobacteria bacterium]